MHLRHAYTKLGMHACEDARSPASACIQAARRLREVGRVTAPHKTI